MIILVISTHTPHLKWKPHFETELELMQRHLDCGDSVQHLYCDAVQLACDASPYHDRRDCRSCVRTAKMGVSLLSQTVCSRPLVRLTSIDRDELASLPKF